MLKILHIVPWYPNTENPVEATFIHEHIKALNSFSHNEVFHLRFGNKNSIVETTFEDVSLLRQTIKPWLKRPHIVKEFQAKKIISNYITNHQERFDVVNFYIAYPNALDINNLSKKYSSLSFCITEQWSSYHVEFNLPKHNKGRDRIEQIFKNTFPLYVVSNALGQDIQRFIGDPNRKYEVVPNVVNPQLFEYKEKELDNAFTFSMVNNWSYMKNPIVVIKAFDKLLQDYDNLRLLIGGDGDWMSKMQTLIKELKLEKNITLLGKVSKPEVVGVLQQSHVYCQSSYYETFSAICIEALSTGTPVIAHRVGGMKDLINESNGLFVENLEVENWYAAMKNIYINYKNYNLKEISKAAQEKYNPKAVGKLFVDKLQHISNLKSL